MLLRKFRWSKVYESSEEELVGFLQQRNIQAKVLHITAFDSIGQPASARGVTAWCAEGSLTLACGQQTAALQPGDAVELPANSPFTLTGGIAGGICYLSSHGQPIALS